MRTSPMSISISIKTKNTFAPEALFDALTSDEGRLAVMASEFPLLRIGYMQRAIRGVEIGEEEGGYYVRVSPLSSKEDYLLFAKSIDCIVSLADGEYYDKADWLRMEEELRKCQWKFSEKEDTGAPILISAPDAPPTADKLSLSVIFLNENKVKPFEYEEDRNTAREVCRRVSI